MFICQLLSYVTNLMSILLKVYTTPEIYTLSLHDALPILALPPAPVRRRCSGPGRIPGWRETHWNGPGCGRCCPRRACPGGRRFPRRWIPPTAGRGAEIGRASCRERVKV